MSVEEFRNQFQRIIDRRGFGDDKYIDSNEEREIVKDCVDIGIPLESAQAVLLEVCRKRGYVLETNLMKKVNASLQASLGDDGKIDQEEFGEAVAICVQEARGRVDEAYCKRLVIRMIERGEAPVKTGFFSDWFKKIKKEVGA